MIGYPTSKPAAEHAVDFIVRAVKAHPNEVTLFVLGPATNIALAIRKNPEIVPLVKRVYYMGGAIDVPGNTSPAAEFNWWFDPEAVRITLRAPFREQIVVPLDIAERVFYTKAEYDRIVGAPETPITKLFRQLHGPRFERDARRPIVRVGRVDGGHLSTARDRHDVGRPFIDIDVTYGPNYGRSIGYHQSRRRSLDSPADFPAGTEKVKVLMDIDRRRSGISTSDRMTRRKLTAALIRKGDFMHPVTRALWTAALVTATRRRFDQFGRWPGTGPKKVFIDQDGASLGTDMISTLAMLQSPEVEVLGITVTAGDTWVKAGTAHMLRMMELTGHGKIPVAQGAAFPLINSRELTQAWEAQYRRVPVQGRMEPRALSPARRGADAADRRHDPEVDRPARRAVHDPADPQVPERGDAVGRRAVHHRGPGPRARPGDRQPRQGAGADGRRLQRRQGRQPPDQRPPRVQLVVGSGGGAHRHERAVEEDYDHAGGHLGEDVAQRRSEAPAGDVEVSGGAVHHQVHAARTGGGGGYMWDEISVLAFLDPSIITAKQELYVNIDIDHGPGYGQTIFVEAETPGPPASSHDRARWRRGGGWPPSNGTSTCQSSTSSSSS